MDENLSESNFLLYAAKKYDNPSCFDTEEFEEDIKRFQYLKRLFNKFRESGEIKERLVINHLIILNNVFGPEFSTKMLFLKLEGYYDILVPFLLFLNTLPEKVYKINNKDIITSEIFMNTKIIEILRNQKKYSE